MQIAIGRVVMDIGDPRGSVLRQATEAERARPRAKPAPVLLRPRVLAELVDRRAELVAAISALDAGMLVEISGEPGIGKTALLRQLAHHPRASAFADGIVYLPARDASPLDLLHRIFEAFYEIDPPALPTLAEIRRGLQGKQALILLDDVRVSREELDLVLDTAPCCAFVVGTRERRLWGGLRGLELAELPVEESVALLEREAGRSFDAAERSAAERSCAAIGGNPLRIQQAAALVREREGSLETWARHLSADDLIAELMASVDDKQRRVLLALSALSGVPIDLQHAAGIAELVDVDALVMPLVRGGLVLSSQSRYLLASGIADRLRRADDLKPWVNRAITYFTAWAERNRRNHDLLRDASEALVRVQEHATEMRRWAEALRLGRVLESTLILDGRWGAWDLVLDRSLGAARAMRDRPAEAWVLHQIGTRAVCLGGAQLAQRVLTQSASLSDELGEPGAAALSRRNLAFIVSDAPVADAAVKDYSLLLRTATHAARRRSRFSEYAAALLTVVLSIMIGGFTYTVTRDRQPVEAAESAAAPAPSASRALAPAPDPAMPTAKLEKANIRIFTARPGSIATRRPTDLCYAVSDAVDTRIEPGIGQVAAADTLTCRRVMPARTTTYELTATGRDGAQVKQQLVIVVR